MSDEVVEKIQGAQQAVDQKEGGPVAFGLNRYDHGSRRRFLFAHEARQGFDGWRAVKDREPQLEAVLLFDLGEQAQRRQRLSTEREEVVANPDALETEQRFPPLREG